MEEGEKWVHHSYVHPALEVRKARNGRGLFVKEGQSIRRDEVMVVWTGRIVTIDGVNALPEEEKDYTLQVYDHLFQVPFTPGKREPADFVNHSCDPNGGVLGEAVLVAVKDIAQGDEITFDYSTTDCVDGEWECNCGSSGCRGTVRGSDWQLPSMWERHGCHFSTYLLRKIDALRKGAS